MRTRPFFDSISDSPRSRNVVSALRKSPALKDTSDAGPVEPRGVAFPG